MWCPFAPEPACFTLICKIFPQDFFKTKLRMPVRGKVPNTPTHEHCRFLIPHQEPHLSPSVRQTGRAAICYHLPFSTSAGGSVGAVRGLVIPLEAY